MLKMQYLRCYQCEKIDEMLDHIPFDAGEGICIMICIYSQAYVVSLYLGMHTYSVLLISDYVSIMEPIFIHYITTLGHKMVSCITEVFSSQRFVLEGLHCVL